ncbi:hypothetical protein BXY75_0043 [Ulvibacter antarcticus]|uniref:Uncharacterized protein n=2 Tax=Ulvibacter antarcticus TaxID=442714 RepID=A0A3L9Z6C8_9FLAO|nr:hypothetical protein BXY75_0043 [Ulvibacter antarcticus]
MVNDITFDRKLEYETAFDGVVKVYSLKTNKENLNDLLIGKYFGSFIHNAEQGVFLRMFKSKKSWPKTRLVYLNFKTEKLRVIKKTRSSYDIWKGTDLGNGRHSIEIKPTEKIKHQI